MKEVLSMKFLDRFAVKTFKVLALFICIAISAFSIETFVNEPTMANFSDLILVLAFNAAIYKFVVPILQRLLAFLLKIDLLPENNVGAKPARKKTTLFNLPGRISESVGKQVGDWMMNASKPSAGGFGYSSNTSNREFQRWNARENAMRQEYIARNNQGNSDGYAAAHRAQQYRNEAQNC